jgi:hypothetical protein
MQFNFIHLELSFTVGVIKNGEQPPSMQLCIIYK